MPVEQILSNAQVVSADRVFYGTVVLRDGLIACLLYTSPSPRDS